MLRKLKNDIQRIVSFMLFVFLVPIGCAPSSNLRLQDKRDRFESSVAVGDNIFEAKEKLANLGFRILSGPTFATEKQNYYLMIVDFGEPPTHFETFKYSTGVQSEGTLIHGLVKADAKGTITVINSGGEKTGGTPARKTKVSSTVN